MGGPHLISWKDCRAKTGLLEKEKKYIYSSWRLQHQLLSKKFQHASLPSSLQICQAPLLHKPISWKKSLYLRVCVCICLSTCLSTYPSSPTGSVSLGNPHWQQLPKWKVFWRCHMDNIQEDAGIDWGLLLWCSHFRDVLQNRPCWGCAEPPWHSRCLPLPGPLLLSLPLLLPFTCMIPSALFAFVHRLPPTSNRFSLLCPLSVKPAVVPAPPVHTRRPRGLSSLPVLSFRALATSGSVDWFVCLFSFAKWSSPRLIHLCIPSTEHRSWHRGGVQSILLKGWINSSHSPSS